ncbi:hypothetical protein NKDENANG_01240 [Candidatus Entotheonellaceae bacterium PAL068K]
MSRMSDTHQYQQHFWQALVHLRVHIYYLRQFHLRDERRQTRLDMFLAVTSNGSIATWAIWGKWPILWAIIIGLSQLINAIRPYLPYQRRIRAITALNRELDELSLHAEHRWYAIAEGHLTNEQIHDETIELKRRKSKAEDTYLGSLPFPENDKLLQEAESQATTYFRTNYKVGS